MHYHISIAKQLSRQSHPMSSARSSINTRRTHNLTTCQHGQERRSLQYYVTTILTSYFGNGRKQTQSTYSQQLHYVRGEQEAKEDACKSHNSDKVGDHTSAEVIVGLIRILRDTMFEQFLNTLNFHIYVETNLRSSSRPAPRRVHAAKLSVVAC